MKLVIQVSDQTQQEFNDWKEALDRLLADALAVIHRVEKGGDGGTVTLVISGAKST